MENSHSKPFATLLVIMTLLVIASVWVERDYLNEYPSHIHAWAEQDHYALAIGFLNNGHDIFHPETMIYNKQFPGWWKEAYDTTVTSAGFPIHEYNVALLMRCLGTTSPWVFRLWTMLWALIGLFFLAKSTFHLTHDGARAFLISAIAMTSPVMCYYLNGFLPSIPAFSISIIGLWCYLRHLDGDKKHFFPLAISFLTLAALIRTTFAITLVATLCFELLRIFRKESTLSDKLLTVSLSFATILGCQLWNRHLTKQHGTIFLNELMPAESWDNAKELLSSAYHHWGTQYFQPLHYYLLTALIILAFAIGIIKYINNRRANKSSGKAPLSLWWFALIQLFGCLLFTIAMMQQIEYHDYYFIDTFFAPLLWIAMLTLRDIPSLRQPLVRAGEWILALTLAFFMVQHVGQTQVTRRASENYAKLCHENYHDSNRLLDSLGMPKEAKVLCLYGYAQNGPFIQMGRKGFIVMQDQDELLEAAFQFPFDCVVVENEKLHTYYEKRSLLFQPLKKIGGNDKISVFLPSNLKSLNP